MHFPLSHPTMPSGQEAVEAGKHSFPTALGGRGDRNNYSMVAAVFLEPKASLGRGESFIILSRVFRELGLKTW